MEVINTLAYYDCGDNYSSVVNAAFLFFETSKLWVLFCIFCILDGKAEGLRIERLLREPFESHLVIPLY